jgi:putative ABC transport system permease protein
MFRREWRQQVLVLVLLTVAVAVAIFSASAAYSATPIREGEFGSANYKLTFDGSDAGQRAAHVSAARAWFGPVDAITHVFVPIPGSVETLDVRAQDPHGAYSGPMLRVLQGRYPASDGEVAVTDVVASTYKTSVGAVLVLDGHRRTVVGVVENPSGLTDEFALVPPSDRQVPESLTLLVKTTETRIRAFHPSNSGPLGIATRRDERATAAVLVLALASVVLLLVCLVAAAGFVALAHRRLRQLGMLAAAGATERQLRVVVIANGLAVGVVAAMAGTALGLAARIAAVPLLERAAQHRIGRFDVPWWLVVSGMGLAVLTATLAAWWPARAIARIPITQALSARPPAPRPAHRSAIAAAVLLAAGFVGLALGIDVAHDRTNPLLLLSGIAAIVVGVLFASPLALRALAAVAARSRLHQAGAARSGPPPGEVGRGARGDQPRAGAVGGCGRHRNRGPRHRGGGQPGGPSAARRHRGPSGLLTAGPHAGREGRVRGPRRPTGAHPRQREGRPARPTGGSPSARSPGHGGRTGRAARGRAGLPRRAPHVPGRADAVPGHSRAPPSVGSARQ